MDKQTVREWFECYAVDMGGELNGSGWDISGDQLDLACEAIAQAAEEEMAKMEHRYQQANQMDRDIAGIARLDVEKAQAQVAVMAKALARITQYAEGRSKALSVGVLMADMERIGTLCHKALSAAPKLAWHNQGTAVVIVDRGDGSLRLKIPAGRYSHWHLEVIGIEDEELDGQQVEVYVTECPRVHEQQG